jgi:hypothetical protein
MTTEVKYAATFSSDSEDFVDEHLGLEVKRSWLSKDDASTFLGLFAAKSFEEGDVVCIYTGKGM